MRSHKPHITGWFTTLFCCALALCLRMGALPSGITIASAEANGSRAFDYPYGVLIGCDPEEMQRFAPYQTVVLDAQYFTAAQIATLHAAGHTVYSYLNIGSLETFRPYYDRFAMYTRKLYENWPDERWVDVAAPAWVAFAGTELANALRAKGIDGFFVDNCDVYDLYPQEATLQALCEILRALRAGDTPVIINGGDGLVTEVALCEGDVTSILTGVNQETVFSAIDFDTETFGRATEEDFAWFSDYVQRVAALGAQVYLLEYTQDTQLIQEIDQYCAEHGFVYMVADSIALDGAGATAP